MHKRVNHYGVYHSTSLSVIMAIKKNRLIFGDQEESLEEEQDKITPPPPPRPPGEFLEFEMLMIPSSAVQIFL